MLRSKQNGLRTWMHWMCHFKSNFRILTQNVKKMQSYLHSGSIPVHRRKSEISLFCAEAPTTNMGWKYEKRVDSFPFTPNAFPITKVSKESFSFAIYDNLPESTILEISSLLKFSGGSHFGHLTRKWVSDIFNCCPTVYQIVHGKLKIKIREKTCLLLIVYRPPIKRIRRNFLLKILINTVLTIIQTLLLKQYMKAFLKLSGVIESHVSWETPSCVGRMHLEASICVNQSSPTNQWLKTFKYR